MSRKANPRWQMVENVVAAIERIRGSVPGMSVRQNVGVPRKDRPTKTRQVDVVVSVPTGPRVLHVGIDVKHHGRPMTIEQVGALIDKRSTLVLDRYCVVSTSGFTTDGEERATDSGLEVVRLEQFEQSDFWATPPDEGFFQVSYSLAGLPRINFADAATHDAARVLMEGAILREFEVEVGEGKRIPLLHVLGAYAREAAATSRAPLPDDFVFSAQVVIPPGQWTRFWRGEVALPMPSDVTIPIRVHRRTVSESRFRVGDLEVSSSQLQLAGVDVQMTLAAVPVANGGKQMVMSMGPIEPLKVRL